MHSNIKAIVVLTNTEWAAQQTRVIGISVDHRKNLAKYRDNNVHDADLIKDVLKILAASDKTWDRRKVKTPEEFARMVIEGMPCHSSWCSPRQNHSISRTAPRQA